MKATDWYGTTCWWCGHAGQRTRREATLTHRCCDDCKYVEGARDYVRECRDRDVEGLKLVLKGKNYTPRYWSTGLFYMKAREHAGYPPNLLDQLKCLEYVDSLAAQTAERRRADTKIYQREWYTKLGKEARGRYYKAKKALMEQKVNELLEWEKQDGNRE